VVIIGTSTDEIIAEIMDIEVHLKLYGGTI